MLPPCNVLSWIRKIIDLLMVGLVPRLMETSGVPGRGSRFGLGGGEENLPFIG